MEIKREAVLPLPRCRAPEPSDDKETMSLRINGDSEARLTAEDQTIRFTEEFSERERERESRQVGGSEGRATDGQRHEQRNPSTLHLPD